MIVSLPGRIPEGKVCESPVAGVDLIPTFFSYAGIDLPWEMHGHDLTPVLENPAVDWPHPARVTFTGRSYGADTDRIPDDPDLHVLNGIPWYVSLRQGRHKYIRTLVENEIEELYDIDADPEELTNLALDATHKRQLKRFRQALITELQRTDAGMVKTLPAVKAE